MKKVLVTGFTPFMGESVNPSYEAINMLPDRIDDIEIIKAQITTEFGVSKDELLRLLAKHKPDAVICFGQAGGRPNITVEKIAVNYALAEGYDENNVIENNTIDNSGNAAYFATIPTEKIVDAINKAGIPCSMSLTAGAFVCNYLMYNLLQKTFGTAVLGGFIHIPYCTEQAIGKKPVPPSMELSVVCLAMKTAIKNIF
ncbi:MAG TPA: pyroglutamyl-peptidase I [Eubacteriales bacterium]|nr:pyroglutamyl-peptidase I [Eubacteriales bacterium]